MTGGGEGPSVVEVATSFTARLFGAIGELKKCLNEEERRRRDLEFSENSKGSGVGPKAYHSSFDDDQLM